MVSYTDGVWSTLLPGWLLVLGSSTTSLRASAMCSTGCQSVNGYYTRSLLPPSTVSVALAGLSYQNWTRSTELPSCSTNRLELFAGTRSTLISRRQFRDGLKFHLFTGAYFWTSENICFKSVIYLLTYLRLCWHLLCPHQYIWLA